MQELATVTRVGPKAVELRMDAAQPEICKTCGACETLGNGKEMILRVPGVEGVDVGDRVAVEVPEGGPWLSIVLVLGLPAALLVGGLLLGSRWPWWVNLLGLDADLSGALLGLPLGVAALLVARTVDRRYGRRIAVTRIEHDDAPPPGA